MNLLSERSISLVSARSEVARVFEFMSDVRSLERGRKLENVQRPPTQVLAVRQHLNSNKESVAWIPSYGESKHHHH